MGSRSLCPACDEVVAAWRNGLRPEPQSVERADPTRLPVHPLESVAYGGEVIGVMRNGVGVFPFQSGPATLHSVDDRPPAARSLYRCGELTVTLRRCADVSELEEKCELVVALDGREARFPVLYSPEIVD